MDTKFIARHLPGTLFSSLILLFAMVYGLLIGGAPIAIVLMTLSLAVTARGGLPFHFAIPAINMPIVLMVMAWLGYDSQYNPSVRFIFILVLLALTIGLGYLVMRLDSYLSRRALLGALNRKLSRHKRGLQ